MSGLFFPSAYAKDQILPKLNEPSYFNRQQLPETVLLSLNSLLVEQVPDNFVELLSKINDPRIPEEVKQLIFDYTYFMRIDRLLESDSPDIFEVKSDSPDIFEVFDLIEKIKDPQAKNGFTMQIACSKLSDAIMSTKSLKELAKYVKIYLKIDESRRDSVSDTFFIQMSHLCNISCVDIELIAEQFKDITQLNEIKDCSLIKQILFQNLSSRLELHEISDILSEEHKTSLQLDNTDKLIKSISLIKNLEFEEDFETRIKKFSDKYQIKDPEPQALQEEEKYISVDYLTVIQRSLASQELDEKLKKLPIKSWDQMTIIGQKLSFTKNNEKHVDVFKVEFLDGNKKIIGAAKSNYIPQPDQSLVIQAVVMITMQDDPGFLKIYGAFYDFIEGSLRYTLVMEFCQYTLTQFIKREFESKEQTLELIKKRCEFAYTASEKLIAAMINLNNKDFSHRDIKPDNIFIGMDGLLKIADFDVSTKIKRDDYGVTMPTIDANLAGTMLFASPELEELLSNPRLQASVDYLYYNKSDVYSLGLTILSIITNKDQKIWNKKTSTLQKTIDSIVDEAVQVSLLKDSFPKVVLLRNVLKAMLIVNPGVRPKFYELSSYFKEEGRVTGNPEI